MNLALIGEIIHDPFWGIVFVLLIIGIIWIVAGLISAIYQAFKSHQEQDLTMKKSLMRKALRNFFVPIIVVIGIAALFLWWLTSLNISG